MIKIENVEIHGWEPAIRGMRNPMNSWDRSDSGWEWIPEDPPMTPDDEGWEYVIGPNDYKLMSSLAKGGPVHAKYRRMIMVYADITAPLYWWKEFDTYKIGTVANSCSTMHKIHSKEFTIDDFSHEDLLTFQDMDFRVDDHLLVGDDYWDPKFMLEILVRMLNRWRDIYNSLDEKIRVCSKNGALTAQELKHLLSMRKRAWKQMIQLLPTSYNQKRTVMLPYEVLANIHPSRRHHKLDEWHVVCDWIESLPYSELIIGEDEVND